MRADATKQAGDVQLPNNLRAYHTPTARACRACKARERTQRSVNESERVRLIATVLTRSYAQNSFTSTDSAKPSDPVWDQ